MLQCCLGSHSMCSSTASSLVSLYTDCQARGENVTLAMESSGGRQVVTFSYIKEAEQNKENRNGKQTEMKTEKKEKHEIDNMENEKSTPVKRERIVFPAQYSGPISCEKAAKKLRKKWPERVVRMVTVRKTGDTFDERCGMEHLEVEAFVENGFNFDNYFARPANNENWPHGFVPAFICNCRLDENSM